MPTDAGGRQPPATVLRMRWASKEDGEVNVPGQPLPQWATDAPAHPPPQRQVWGSAWDVPSAVRMPSLAGELSSVVDPVAIVDLARSGGVILRAYSSDWSPDCG